MKRFKNILYVAGQNPLQETAGTLDIVAQLARLNEAKVTVFIGDDYQKFQDMTLNLNTRFRGVAEEASAKQQEDLKEFLKQERWSGIDVDMHLSEEKGFIPIIRKVLRDKHDLVIREAALEKGIDQLSMRLVRKCPCPVWIIKKRSVDFKRILAAVDVGEESHTDTGLNKKIIELGYSLAQREQGEAFYFHSWRLQYESMLTSPRFKVTEREINEMKREIKEERQDKLQQLLKENNITALDDHLLIREGHSKDIISELIEELNIDLVVMGSIGRSGVPGFLIGNEAEKVLNTINCTVLTVKPDDFISPVTL